MSITDEKIFHEVLEVGMEWVVAQEALSDNGIDYAISNREYSKDRYKFRVSIGKNLRFYVWDDEIQTIFM